MSEVNPIDVLVGEVKGDVEDDATALTETRVELPAEMPEADWLESPLDVDPDPVGDEDHPRREE